jgi:hypothetical protein
MAMAFTLLFTTSPRDLRAQCGTPPVDVCSQPDCLVDQISVNTGFDHTANGTYPIGARDGYWTVVADGLPSRLPVPRPADVIAAAPIWPAPFPNTQWLNGNGGAPDGAKVKVTYETCFCICGPNPSTLTFDLTLYADATANVYVDNVAVGSTPNPGFPNATNLKFNQTLNPGKHCIEVEVNNTSGTFSGFDLMGTVKGPNLLGRDCCGKPDLPRDDCDTNHVTYGTDTEWSIESGPVNCTFPICADSITSVYWPSPWGSPLPGSYWIASNAGGSSCPGCIFRGNPPDMYTYRKSFCVNEPGTFIITITGMADDSGVVDLNGVTLSPAGTLFNYAVPTTQTYIVSLERGCNCLDIRVFDLGCSITGLDAVLDIQGGHLAKPECCDCDECFYSRPQRRDQNGNDGATLGLNDHDFRNKPMLAGVPNPATNETTIHYVIDADADAHVELYNVAGQRVKVIDEGARAKGAHAVPLSTEGLAKGAYHIRLTYGTHVLTVPLEVR